MGNNFFTQIQQLEMLAFFSGYPLIYYLVRVLAGNASLKNRWGARLILILPFTYALIGTLYLGLQLKKLYPDYSIDNFSRHFQQPWLFFWGILSVLFWIPVLSRRPILSLLHSLVFFLIIIKDLFYYLTGAVRDRDIIRNEMIVYMVSIFLNLAAYILVFLSSLNNFRKKKLKP